MVCADLRGYGDSSKPRGLPDHSNYSKRVMAADMVALMRSLGHERFDRRRPRPRRPASRTGWRATIGERVARR